MMELGDAERTCSDSNQQHANINSNSNILSDEDIKLSFEALEDAIHCKDEEDNTIQETEQISSIEKQAATNHPEEGVDEGEDSDQAISQEKEKWLEQLEVERSQWEALESVQIKATGDSKSIPSVSFEEAYDHFSKKDMDKSSIRTSVERTGLRAFLYFLFGPPKLHHSLINERDAVFCIAQVQLKDGEEIHSRVLQTIYKKLTRSKFDCPRRGPHWEDIGFQGNDPATDLRGVGFLGLLNILYAVDHSEMYGLFMDIYRLSLHQEQNFPFCVMSFNVTRIILQVLREGLLSREMNKVKGVFEVVNKFYVAVFYHIYYVWKSQNKTMKDSGHVMKDIEKTAHKHPKRLMRALEEAMMEREENKLSICAPAAGPQMDYKFGNRTLSIASSDDSEHKNFSIKHQVSTTNTETSQTHYSESPVGFQRFAGRRVENEPVTEL